MGVAEGKEWSKGHATLCEQCSHESIAYCSRRHSQRIISDCFARGILRTPNETVKLIDGFKCLEPTEAEMCVLTPFSTFSGEAFLSLVENRASQRAAALEKGLLWARTKNGQQKEGVFFFLKKR